ncbi:MAG: BrnT family toxin [Nitrospira sp.]
MKHGISFEEAMTVFNDPLAHIFGDSDHSMTESREIIVGVSQKQRLLLVCFTERRKAVRIISTRKATKLERQDYEEAHRP